MEEKTTVFESLLDTAQDYAKTSLALIKLKTIDKLSEVVSSLVSRILAFFFFLMFLITGSIGISLWLGDILGNTWYGFFVVAAFYGLLAIILIFVLHKWFRKQISNFIIRQSLK